MAEEVVGGVISDSTSVDRTKVNDTAGPSVRKLQSRQSPSDGKSDRQDDAKRPRRIDADLAARGKRMFGMLNSTLSKAKEDNARRSSGEAARKRAEIEAKAHERLRAEEENIKQTKELSEQLRKQLQTAYDLALEIHSIDTTIRLRKTQKRRLASFLVTSSRSAKDDGAIAEKMSVDRRSIEAEIACCLAPLPSRPRPDPPVYYLPKKMLPKQDDTLDDQEDRVDDAIDEADQAWEKERKIMQDRLNELKKDIQRIRVDLLSIEKGTTNAKERDR